MRLSIALQRLDQADIERIERPLAQLRARRPDGRDAWHDLRLARLGAEQIGAALPVADLQSIVLQNTVGERHAPGSLMPACALALFGRQRCIGPMSLGEK